MGCCPFFRTRPTNPELSQQSNVTINPFNESTLPNEVEEKIQEIEDGKFQQLEIIVAQPPQ